jgi:hypothetical protein
MGAVCDAPKHLQKEHKKSLITDHRNRYNNDGKVRNIARIAKM